MAYMYLTDPTLSSKLTLFRGKGISDSIIKTLLEKGLLTDSLENITKKVETIEANGEKLNEENLRLLKKDLVTYYKRIELLKSLGIELDANELRNYVELIIRTPYLEADIEVLKQYMVRIVRKNGKYALEIFWKSPKELTEAIDHMIEASLENVIVNNPETLGLDIEELLRRVRYCEANNIPHYNREREMAEHIITNPLEFYKQFPNVNLDEIPNLNNNANLVKIISGNEYANILLDALNKYYAETELAPIELTEEQKEDHRVLTEMFEKNFGVEVSSPNTYRIAGIPVSKKKVERNLMFLLDMVIKEGRSLQGLEKDIMLIAILHNLRVNEETMKNIVNSAMGFNQSVGGPTL